MEQTTTPWNDTQKILALLVTASFMGVIFVWFFHPPAVDGGGATAVLNTLVGTLGGLETMIVSFYFGSSRNANTKDNTIASLVQQPTQGAAHTDLPKSTPTG